MASISILLFVSRYISQNWYIFRTHLYITQGWFKASNERSRYTVKESLIGWAQIRNQSCHSTLHVTLTRIARFMGPTWDPSGSDRTQVGPMLAPWTLLSGNLPATRDAKQRKTAMCSVNHALCIVFRNWHQQYIHISFYDPTGTTT